MLTLKSYELQYKLKVEDVLYFCMAKSYPLKSYEVSNKTI